MPFQKLKDSANDYDWTKLAPYSLGIGLLALFYAFMTYLIRGQFDVYTYLPLGIGLVGVLAFAFLDPTRVQGWMGSRQARFGTNVLVMGIALLGIVVVVNYIIYQESGRSKLWIDLTESKSNTLSPETIRTLHTLQVPIEIRAYFNDTSDNNSTWKTASALLDKYKSESGGKITYTKLSTNKDRGSAIKDGVSKDGTLVLVTGDQKQIVTNMAEQDLTNGIILLLTAGEHKVYFLTGHGEASISGTGDTDMGTIVGTLKSKSFTVETLNLVEERTIPEDAEVLVIAGPKEPLKGYELTAIKNFLRLGGGLILLQDPYGYTEMDPAADILALYLSTDWGVTIQNDVIVDRFSSRGITAPVAYQFGSSPITANIRVNSNVVFPTSESIELKEPEGKSLNQVTLATIGSTNPNNHDTWGETTMDQVPGLGNSSPDTIPTYDDGVDHPSPLNVAVSCEDTSTKTRIVVFGDVDFAENADVSTSVNSDLLTNSVDWASHIADELVGISSPQDVSRMIVPPSSLVLNAIFLTSIVLIPGSFIAIGIAVWYNRRKHK
jgi:gliding motility-associatede transport system auxiliary component